MKTGEGKTLVATLPGVPQRPHRARRAPGDRQRLPGPARRRVDGTDLQLPRAHRRLHPEPDERRRAASRPTAADITYGTNNEFGFDYLRDNMKFDLERMVQREPHLRHRRRGGLDPGRRGADAADHLGPVGGLGGPLLPGRHDHPQAHQGRGDRGQARQQGRSPATTSSTRRRTPPRSPTPGWRAPRSSSASTTSTTRPNIDLLHAVKQGLRAHALYQRDREYIVKDGEVIIVDEFTGRLMAGPTVVRRPPPGGRGQGEGQDPVREPDPGDHHPAELLPHVREARGHDRHRRDRGRRVRQDLRSRRVGDPDQPATWSVSTIPTSSIAPRRRSTRRCIEEIVEMPRQGTAGAGRHRLDREVRALSSKLLQRRKVQHVVLNAKYHEREADIVAQAGRLGRGDHRHQHGRPRHRHRARRQPRRPRADARSIRRRTRKPMPGRPATKFSSAVRRGRRQSVLDAGGLHIIGTERHESRRIDNQLRGRSGRQGDPGAHAFLPLARGRPDAHLRLDWVRKMMDRLGMEEDVPIESKMVTKSIERAQKQVEGRNFEIRKHLLEYDDVMNKQREAVYRLRRRILEGVEGRDYIVRVVGDIVASLVDRHCPAEAIPRTGKPPPWTSNTAPISGFGSKISVSTGTPSTCPISRRAWAPAPATTMPSGSSSSVTRASRGSSGSSSWTPSTGSGRTTCSPSTTCARASACAPTVSATPWWSTSASRTSSSRTCGSASRTTW